MGPFYHGKISTRGMKCAMQSAIMGAVGFVPGADAPAFMGLTLFLDGLKFVRDVFPCAQNVLTLSGLSWDAKTDGKLLRLYKNAYQSDVYLMSRSDWANATSLNSMLQWLGVTECSLVDTSGTLRGNCTFHDPTGKIDNGDESQPFDGV